MHIDALIAMDSINIQKTQSTETWPNNTYTRIKTEHSNDDNVICVDDSIELPDAFELQKEFHVDDMHMELSSVIEEELSEISISSEEPSVVSISSGDLHNTQISEKEKYKKTNQPNHDGASFRINPHQSTRYEAVFGSSSHLKNHMETDPEEQGFLKKTPIAEHSKPYQCSVCEVALASAGHLKRHMAIHSESRFKCEICGRAFLKKSTLEEHRNGHLGIKPHKCTFCIRTFSSAQGLRKHMNFSHKPKDYDLKNETTKPSNHDENDSCDDLEIKDDDGKNTEEIKSQYNSTSGCIYTCPICLNSYGKRRTLDIHMISHTSRFKCEHCGKTFQSAHQFEEHNQRHKGIKPHKCTECKVEFTTARHLKQHMQKHTSHYKCDHCSKTFQGVKYLEDHVRRHLGIKPHQCTVCKASFASARELKLHMVIHSEHEYKCELCRRTFSKKATLEVHKNIHLGIKPHKCTNCTRGFSSPQALWNHKKYQRDVCERNSLKNSALKDRTTNSCEYLGTLDDKKGDNSDEGKSAQAKAPDAPFKCPVCTITYASGVTLEKHLRTHTIRFKCEHCDARFQSAELLNKHITLHIAEKEKTATQEMNNQLEEPASKSNTVDLWHAINFAEMEARYNFDVAQEFELIADEDEITGEQTFYSITEVKEPNQDGSVNNIRITSNSTRQENIFKGITDEESLLGHIVKVEKRDEYDISTSPLGYDSDKNELSCEPSDDTVKELSSVEDQCNRHLEENEQSSAQCRRCLKSFANHSLLKAHLIIHTSRFKCAHCSKSFPNPQQLEHHIQQHPDINPYQCSKCEASYTSYTLLRQHVKIHSNIVFECDICELTFPKKSALVEHRNGHLNVKPYQCRFCIKSFSLAAGLVRHENTKHKSELLNSQTNSPNQDNGNNSCDELNMRNDILEENRKECPKYLCDICPNTYITRRGLKKHLKTHGPDFKCDICESIFLKRSALVEHRNVHLEVRPHHNSLAAGLVEHTNTEHKSECQRDDCNRILLKSQTDSPIQNVGDNSCELNTRADSAEQNRKDCTKYLCPICPNSYTTRRGREIHLKTHGSRFKCDICESTFFKKSALVEHRNGHLEVRPHQCTFCTKSFSLAAGLVRHTNTKHKSEYQRKTFPNKVVLKGQTDGSNQNIGNNSCDKLNTRDNVEERPEESLTFLCPICHNSYVTRRGLEIHLITHSSRFKCEHCSKSMPSAAHLEDHIRRHLGIRSHRCTLCNAAFVSAGDLVSHKKHKHSKKFQCDICKRSFLKKTTLDEHRNVHLAIRAHKCNFCIQSFSSASGLSKHMNSKHVSDHQYDGNRQNPGVDTTKPSIDVATFNYIEAKKPAETKSACISVSGSAYKCPFCSNTYGSHFALCKHLNKHTGQFKCKHCDKIFLGAANLKKHIKVHMFENEKISSEVGTTELHHDIDIVKIEAQ